MLHSERRGDDKVIIELSFEKGNDVKISVEILIGVILFILILAAFLIWMQARLQIITP